MIEEPGGDMRDIPALGHPVSTVESAILIEEGQDGHHLIALAKPVAESAVVKLAPGPELAAMHQMAG